MANKMTRYKMLKNSYNDLCEAAIVLEDNEISIGCGSSSLNVNSKSIDLQPSPNGSINLASLNIKQPLCRQSSLPYDFVPTFFNQAPRKTFDLPMIEEVAELGSLTTSLGAFLLV